MSNLSRSQFLEKLSREVNLYIGVKQGRELSAAVEGFLEMGVVTRTPLIIRNFGTFAPRRSTAQAGGYNMSLRVSPALQKHINGNCRFLNVQMPSELVEYVKNRLEVSRGAAAKMLRTYFQALAEQLALKNNVQLIGAGSFKTVFRQERLATIAGKVHHVPAKYAVHFTPGKKLRNR